MFREARQNRIFQDVVDQIQEAILSGRLKAGDMLPVERELKEMFRISRSTLREALRVLEQKGLIEIKLGGSGGALIKTVNTDQMSESLDLLIRSQKVPLHHLAEFREGMEGHVVSLAAERAGKKDIQGLKALLGEAQKYAKKGPSHRSDFLRVDRQFHQALARITGNQLYISILQTVHDNINRYYDKFLPMGDREIKENCRDLEDMVKAIEQGRSEEARTLALNHIQRFARYMKHTKDGNRSNP